MKLFFNYFSGVNSLMLKLDFIKTGGLIPAIAQDYKTNEILMLAYINEEAWKASLSTGKATYYSRSRQRLWIKGETSGNVQLIKEIRVDCDNDTVIFKVDQIGGAACHTGHKSCFFQQFENDSVKIIGKPVFDPREVYNK